MIQPDSSTQSQTKLVEPERHCPQTQPITVALKNICRDYPAGGGVLRELLQNADDAGASTVKFVLDQKYYPTDKLVDRAVAEYQGPALLAYNNATFSEADFGSLSRIGDSGKLQDGTTTGRFGRGFNAVYNWTDSPSVLSGRTLLILDPHHSWTKPFKEPGGPQYDFVKDANKGAMKDQMAAFSSLMNDFDRPFQGTIIRVPLRTMEQVEKSKICKREASWSEIAKVLQTFAQDFGHTGLLFMKNVSRISVAIGDDPVVDICIANDEQVKSHKLKINAEIKKVVQECGGNFNSSFEVEVQSGTPGDEQVRRFAIHHSIQNYPEDKTLQYWSRMEALVPWVAVASEIGLRADKTSCGSLFNVLPSQIRIDQPLYIHSCFSMSPDRARLHQIGDSGDQYPFPGQWNNWLFDCLIPTAWKNLLLYLARQYPDQSTFDSWPKSQENPKNILHDIDKRVLRNIEKSNHCVWYTDIGYTTLTAGLISEREVPAELRVAFKEAGVPIIYLPNNLLSSVKTTCKAEYLTPEKLCEYLKNKPEQLRTLNQKSKTVILEYVISDPEFRGYGAVEIFPFEDGTYKAIDNSDAFIHRDKDEQSLFDHESNKNIDLQKLSPKTVQVLRKGCSTSLVHRSLRFRSPKDVMSYCLQNQFSTFPQGNDTIPADEKLVTFISKLWNWIIVRKHSILDENISCLWLLPLSNGMSRKIKPASANFQTIYAAPGELGDFLKKFSGTAHVSNKPIIQTKSLPSKSILLLEKAIAGPSRFCIMSSQSVDDFMLWLMETRQVFEQLSESDRYCVQKLLASRVSDIRDFAAIKGVVQSLSIFEAIEWKQVDDNMLLDRKWVALKNHHDVIGLRTIEPVPNVGGVTFVNAKSKDTAELLGYFQLAECPPRLEILKRFMIPFWGNKKMTENWNISAKEKITKSLLQDFYNLDDKSRNDIASLAMIPANCGAGEEASRFATARELVDPSSTKLKDYFFADEEVYPVGWVARKYTGVLIECGLRTDLDGDLVLDRAKCFARRSTECQETSRRARSLLQSSPTWVTSIQGHSTLALQELQWLPVTDSEASLLFESAKDCRGLEEKLLVGHVLPTLDFEIPRKWRKRLGWDSIIPQNILFAQLRDGIEKKNQKVVNAVLSYFQEKNYIKNVCPELMKLSFILSSDSQFVPHQKAFQKGCGKLQPYLYNVDKTFWMQHMTILKHLDVLEKPGLDDLLRIQDQLPSGIVLNENDIPVAIQISKLASTFPGKNLSSFKILDATGVLRSKEDVVFNDLPHLEIIGDCNSTHPDVPQTVIKAFQIEPLSSRVKKGELEIEDANDDEFEQREDTVTAISDTLTRYKVETTFKEFLANADDCKSAKVLNWLLDEREHPKDKLLTEELGRYQGPALLVHNDGVFEDEDFNGLRHVGRGSKRHDTTTIGKFGRGALTMYHWTDVPMLLSGEWLLILDPQQHVLDINYLTGHRKAGVKIKISKLKHTYRNQLAPFEELWGFSCDLDYYPGTIFRFPLRHLSTKSKLLEHGIPLDSDATCRCIEDFMGKDGRTSLLFLRRIEYMDFKIYGDKEPRWSIISDRSSGFSSWNICTITKRADDGLNEKVIDRWRVAIEDLKDVEEARANLPIRHRDNMKNIECGIAAFIPEPNLEQRPFLASLPIPKYFSNLPLPFSTDLPVHIHATFLLASDRASIATEDSMQEDGAQWNRWLFSCAIPRLYLEFLEDIGRETRWVKNPFQFWPQDALAEKHISKPVYESFWEMLSGSSSKVFPVTKQIKAAELGERRPPELVKISEAIFDFLPYSMSLALRDILESQFPKLVRPDAKVGKEIQERMMTTIESVSPTKLRGIFKDEKISKALEPLVSQDPLLLEEILSFITPVSDGEFVELNGCRVLPLADGTLGTLRLINPSEQEDRYFSATKEDLLIFDFASNILFGKEIGNRLKKAVFSFNDNLVTLFFARRKFNVSQISLSDFGELLEYRTWEDESPTEDNDAWRDKFWNRWHSIEASLSNDKIPSLLSLDICNYPVSKATRDGVDVYIEPVKLDALPSIIEPLMWDEKSLCRRFPGIYIFNSAYLPRTLKTNEDSFRQKASFARFVIAISKLADKENMGLEAYVKKYLEDTEIQLLQDLVVHYVGYDPTTIPLKISSLLMMLPIWPNTQHSIWVSATTALATEICEFIVPWMDGYDNFIDVKIFTANSFTLKAFGVNAIPGIELLRSRILPKLPEKVHDIAHYQKFITAIPQLSNWKDILSELRNSKLAPNRTMKLVLASELFDYENQIFRSAFRHKANTMFLLEEIEKVEGNKFFWRHIGLKHTRNGQFNSADYFECLMTITARLEGSNDPLLHQQAIEDALIVLSPLTNTMRNTSLESFSEQDWRDLTSLAVFPAANDFSQYLSYRREKMVSLAAHMPLLQLPEIIRPSYLPICWSQVSFPEVDPTVNTFEKLDSKGKPSTAIVWKHIEYMANSTEKLNEDAIAEFLLDIDKSYDYLQDNLNDSIESFEQLRGAQLWFNTEFTDTKLITKADLESSRCRLENLILESSCDTRHLKFVGPFLFRYHKLLRALRCKAIEYPHVQTLNAGTDNLLNVWNQRMRDHELYKDLSLESNGGNIQVHKYVMAAASGFFRTQFKEHWSNQDVIDLKLFSHSTISVVVEFAYTGEFNSKSMQVEDDEDDMEIIESKLDELLDLLDAANYLFIPELKTEVENLILRSKVTFIREHNVRGVLDRASSAEAIAVKQYCEDFYKKNKEAVDLAMED